MKWLWTGGLSVAVGGAVVASLASAPPMAPATAVSSFMSASALMFNTSHDCSFCHNLHGGSAAQLLQNPVVEALCLSCHGPAGPATLKADVHAYDNSTCMDCHVPHSNVTNWLGGTNLKLVRDSVREPMVSPANLRPVVFESRGTGVGDPSLHSFCDGDEDGNGVWDGVCDTCHSNTGRHNYPDPQDHSHQQGKTCTRSSCHIHATGFIR